MRIQNIAKVFLAAFILVSCAPVSNTISVETMDPSMISLPTSTPVPTALTPTIEWLRLPTPLNLSYSTNDEIILIIDELFPRFCVKDNKNLLTVRPTPIESSMQVSTLRFTEITALPDPESYYYYERADNVDNSRSAFVGCYPEDCSKLYLDDHESGKYYEVKFGAVTNRPIGHLQWINKDTVVVSQGGHVWLKIVAINVDKQQFEYYGMTPGCREATRMP